MEAPPQSAGGPAGLFPDARVVPGVDASLLLAAVRGALPASDPRSRITLAAVRDLLTEDGYVYRSGRAPLRSANRRAPSSYAVSCSPWPSTPTVTWWPPSAASSAPVPPAHPQACWPRSSTSGNDRCGATCPRHSCTLCSSSARPCSADVIAGAGGRAPRSSLRSGDVPGDPHRDRLSMELQPAEPFRRPGRRRIAVTPLREDSRRRAVTRVWTHLEGALWPLPAVAVVLSIALGVGLPAVDGLLEEPGGDHPLTFVFGGGPAAARDVLAAIAGSLISVTGLTISLTVVALQLAGSQSSPRMLQTFATDRTVQLTLAQLTSAFVFALTVLRTVRTETATAGAAPAFVPRLSVTVAYVLTLGSVISLLLFLGHLAELLRVETMLRDVHDEAHLTFSRELSRERRSADAGFAVPDGPAVAIPASSSGFLVDVDERRLVAAAAAAGTVVLLSARFGDSVVSGVPIAHAWPTPAGRVDVDRLRDGVDRALSLHFERLPSRDVAYSLRKRVDVTVRALSPGINDPTNAVHALSPSRHCSVTCSYDRCRPRPTGTTTASYAWSLLNGAPPTCWSSRLRSHCSSPVASPPCSVGRLRCCGRSRGGPRVARWTTCCGSDRSSIARRSPPTSLRRSGRRVGVALRAGGHGEWPVEQPR